MAGRSTRETRLRPTTAVYWGSPTPDGYGGRTFAEPVEIPCRWEDRQELFTDAGGQERRSNAVVFPDRDLVVGGYLCKTTLADLSSAEEGNPGLLKAAYEIRRFDSVPDLRATRSVRQAWL